MGENKSGFVPPGVDPWAGDREQRKGKKERDAAIGSGPRAKEALDKAAEEARSQAQQEINRYNRTGQMPKDLLKVGKAIAIFRRIGGRKS